MFNNSVNKRRYNNKSNKSSQKTTCTTITYTMPTWFKRVTTVKKSCILHTHIVNVRERNTPYPPSTHIVNLRKRNTASSTLHTYIVNLRERSTAPSSNSSEDSWSKISSRVQTKSSIDTKRCSHRQHNESDQERSKVCTSSCVLFIQQSKDGSNKQSCP